MIVNLTLYIAFIGFNDTYCCVYLLSPADPEFSVIAKKFIEVLMENFGTGLMYRTVSVLIEV